MKEQGFFEINIYDNTYEIAVVYNEENEKECQVINDLHRMLNLIGQNLNTMWNDIKNFVEFINNNNMKWYFREYKEPEN